MKNPLVTIITPTYNRAKLLAETIESVLSQNYARLEYIIIDDGSTDKTNDLVNVFKKKKYGGKKIIYIKQKNSGETSAVNKGFSLAKGEYVTVVNSDDPLLPSCISEQIKFLEKHPDILAIYPDWKMIDKKGQTINIVYPQNYNYRVMLKEHYCMPGPGTIFRREAIKLTNGRPLEFKYIADFAFWLKLGMYGKLYHFPKVLATFRVHNDAQGTHAQGREMAAEHKKLVDWIFSDKDLPKTLQNVRNASYASAYCHAAHESGNFSLKLQYYQKAFVTDPFVFTKKIIYELKKLKQTLLQRLLLYSFT